MRTKALIIIIAVVLACGVTGVCFALYNMPATDKTVNITNEGYVTLDINTTSNFALTGVNPDINKTLDVTLKVTGSPDAGKEGTFKISLDGALVGALDVSTTIDNNAYDTEALTAGRQLPLNATTDFTLTFSIKPGTDFPQYADKQANVTLQWTTENWKEQDKYYLVGTINGKTQWTPNSDAYVTSEPTNGNHAEFLDITLKKDDKIKIYNPVTKTWQATFTEYNSGSATSSIDAEGNFIVPTDGTYDIYLNSEDKIYISKRD